LREFVIPETATDRVEITGNLYLRSAHAIEKQDPAQAVRIYTKLLGEDSWPKSENDERGRLPGLVAALIRAQIAKAEEAGATVGDPAQALETAAKRPPAERLGPLLEVWCAKNSPRGARASAGAELALAHAQLKHPYESMEWLERAVALGMDPGEEKEGVVADAIKAYPGLPERMAPVSKALGGMRTPPSARKPGFLGLRVVEVVGRGVRVDSVARGGPGESAGLQFGDFLSALGESPLRVPSDLDQALKTLAEGDEIELRYERSGEKKLVRIKLAAVPPAVDYPSPPVAPSPPAVAARVGVLQAIITGIGHIVKLEQGAEVKAGESLQIVRNGEVVAELVVSRIAKPDATYPNGSAICKAMRGTGVKGDDVRRKP
ncbi:MAG TPA: PDZ domain-containing protein, partial [Planctomycetota bacterium]|nr:PDZ domain-containing protein [Planctomycetota bacterium]